MLLYRHGKRKDSRNGAVLKHPTPVTTVLTHPCERVVFHPWRDANPFFHIVEAAWMLAGRDTLADLTPYVARMAEFSDDGGVTQPGAYGKRWRNHFRLYDGPGYTDTFDQLNWAVARLRANPDDRRVVIEMWDPNVDILAAARNGKDLPCNISMLPWVEDGKLHLTVFNRSHDIIWGLYGANAVHFSVVLEYLAGRIGLPVGTMTTVSNNFHAYEATLPPREIVEKGLYSTADPYTNDEKLVQPYDMFYDWDAAVDGRREHAMRVGLDMFFNDGPEAAIGAGHWPWLYRVLAPMAQAHALWKNLRGHPGRYAVTMDALKLVEASDWRRAGEEWVIRRRDKA